MDTEHSESSTRGHGFRPRREAVQSELELLAPPPSVLEDVSRAARRYDELGAQGRRLHFELVGGRLRVELRDLEGNVLRHVSPAEALAVACGATP
jgi:hypothetical protein